MGSPMCPTCGSPDRLVRFCRDTKYVWKRSCGVPCPNDDFHATPTPPAPAMRHWQHDETGRVCDCVDCPGPRYHEVNEAFAEAHEKAMREKCGTPAPADDARPMVTGGGLIKFDRRADDATVKPGGLTHDEIRTACKNVGIDLSCGECASVFYTGAGAGASHTCRADDASGAEAMREACVAPAHDMAPRIVVEPYGTSCWQVWLHIGAASWTVGDYRRDKDAAERFAEPLRHALRAALAALLPARDDAVEEAAMLREALLAQRKAWLDLPACGGTYCDEPDESGRMDCCQDATYHAAGEAIRAIDAALRREKGGGK